MKMRIYTPLLLVLLNLGLNHGIKNCNTGNGEKYFNFRGPEDGQNISASNCTTGRQITNEILLISPGPDPAYCGRPSSIADLFCFLSGSLQPGQSYVYIGFDDYIVAFCSYYYDCQPAQRANLNILDVYGYIVNLTYPMKNGSTGFNLYYIDVTVEGCPQFQKVLDPNFNANVFDTALLHTPKPLGFSYSSYDNVYQKTNLSCNTFRSIKVKGDCSNPVNQYSCPVKSPYMFKTPIASLDFAHIKNVALQELNGPNYPPLAGEVLVDDNGLYATCYERPDYNETLNSVPLNIEYCTADRYDNFPYCGVPDPRNSLARIVESYGYDKYTENCLNASTACTISTLYAQGFNKDKFCGKDYSNCNCNSFTTFCGFSFLLPEFGPQDLGITVVFTSGYCEIGFKQDIMRKFLSIC